MSWRADFRTLYHLAVSPQRGSTQAERMEGFYQGQADHYDGFRERLLLGRRELAGLLEPRGVWIDLGAGTGINAEFIADKLAGFEGVYQVDLSPSLLQMAQERAQRHGWRNVHTVEADATRFVPPEGTADTVTFSYSLTMIPNWMDALDHAWNLLRPGGTIGLVDFYVTHKVEWVGRASHGWLARSFWPVWFAWDNVFLNPDHLTYLHRRFEPLALEERLAPIPYLPLGRVPYYLFLGRKPA